jgi:hypothetical protein
MNRRGAAGNGGVGGEIGGICGTNRWGDVGGAGKGAPGVGSALLRGAVAPDRILSHTGRHGSGSFIGLAPTPARFWGRQCGPLFGPKPKFRIGRVLGGVLGPPMEML